MMPKPTLNNPTTTNKSAAQEAFIVIAAYNESSSIIPVIEELRKVYPHVVVVDDGSKDETFAEASSLAPYVLRHLVNRGQGAALQTGTEFALACGAQFVVTFDADGQHRVSDIGPMLAAVAGRDCDVAFGSRFLGATENMPKSRRLLLKIAVLFSRLVHRIPVTDAHNGLRVLSRHAAQKMVITLDGMAHASEYMSLVRRHDLKMKEFPVVIRYTEHSLKKGQGGMNAFRIVADYFAGRLLR